jgi:hypothetical protein
MPGETQLDLCQYLLLTFRSELLGGNYVGIVGAPIADPDFGVLADHPLKVDSNACRSMEQRLAPVGGSPLWGSNEIFAPGLGTICSAACLREALDECLLL